jgi:hypothetical protein
MRNKMFALLVLFVASVWSAFSYAGDYTFNNGFYWRDGQAFNRVASYEYYYSDGCRYRRQIWKYTAVDGAYNNLSAQTEGWRTKLLDIAAKHKVYQDQLAASANEQQEFEASVRLLGLEGVVSSYEFTPQYSGHSSGYSGNFDYLAAQQGSTITGYREQADIYGNMNLGELYNQVLRLRSQSAELESKATSETIQATDNLSARAAQLESQRAKNDILSKLAEAATSDSHAQVIRELYTVQSNGGSTDNVGKAELGKQLTAVLNKRCVSCHNATKQNGGLRLDDLSLITDAQSKEILERINSSNPMKRMPLKDVDTPGEPLPVDEKAVFFLAGYGDHGDAEED